MLFKNSLVLFFILMYTQGIAGRVDTLELKSVQLKKLTKVVVIRPTTAKNDKATYPVIYLLHGHGGNYAQWPTTAPQLSQTAEELKVIFVCPDGGVGSWYFDSPVLERASFMSMAHGLSLASPRSIDVVHARAASSSMGVVGPVGGAGVDHAQHVGVAGRAL